MMMQVLENWTHSARYTVTVHSCWEFGSALEGFAVVVFADLANVFVGLR